MATSITTIQASDQITDSRAVINDNFASLNTNKIETDYIDTDTTLAANSDTKIATQKAVKTYVDTGGNVNASTTQKGIVEQATDAEVLAQSSTGGTGASLFINPSSLSSAFSAPVDNYYTTLGTYYGDSTTQFDITNTSGTTYRYTYDGNGTDPSISSSNPTVGSGLNIQAQNFSAGNKGSFVVTASGTNYFEVTNANGVAETNKTIGNGFIAKGVIWTKPSLLKYVVVELVGGGGGGGAKDQSAGSSTSGAKSSFGSHLSATGGTASGGAGGVGSSGDFNANGQGGQKGDNAGGSATGVGGQGGSSLLGGGGNSTGNGGNYGGGGGGADSDTSGQKGGSGGGGGGYSKKKILAATLGATEVAIVGAGGAAGASAGTGAQGIVIVREYYV